MTKDRFADITVDFYDDDLDDDPAIFKVSSNLDTHDALATIVRAIEQHHPGLVASALSVTPGYAVWRTTDRSPITSDDGRLLGYIEPHPAMRPRDIVDRLRGAVSDGAMNHDLLSTAADEIERLRAENAGFDLDSLPHNARCPCCDHPLI